MTELVLIRRYPDTDTKGTGIGWYSDELESILTNNNVDYKPVNLKLSTDEGHLNCLKKGFIEPHFELKDTEASIYHATDEMCCLEFPRLKGKKIVTFHHVLKTPEGCSMFLSPVWKVAAKRAIKYSDAIIAVSEQTKNDIVTVFGANPNKIHVVEHRFNPMFRDLRLKRKKIIGLVGTLLERKNIPAGLRIFKRFTEMPGTEDYRFVICGKGPKEGELKSLAVSLGIEDRVDFVSDLSREEILTFYNEMVVLINASMQEGLGLAGLEAQACGTPVVYFEDAEIPENVVKYQIPSKDEEEFAQNVYKLATDDDYRNSITKMASFGLSQEEHFEKLKEIYSETLGYEF